MSEETLKKIRNKQRVLNLLHEPNGAVQVNSMLGMSLNMVRLYIQELTKSKHVEFHSFGDVGLRTIYSKYITVNPKYSSVLDDEPVIELISDTPYIHNIKERHPTRVKHSVGKTYISGSSLSML